MYNPCFQWMPSRFRLLRPSSCARERIVVCSLLKRFERD